MRDRVPTGLEDRSLTFTCRSGKSLKLRPEGYKATEEVKRGIHGSKNGNCTSKDLWVTERVHGVLRDYKTSGTSNVINDSVG